VKNVLSMSRQLAFCLDAILLGLLLVLLAPRLTGLPAHEWVGISLVAPVLLHLLVSWNWISGSARHLGEATTRTRINFTLNVLFFVLLTCVIVSGFVISEIVVPKLGVHTINDRSWRALHNLTLNWLVLVAAMHVAMNWTWIRRMLQYRVWADASERRLHLAPSWRMAGPLLIVTVAAGLVAGAAWLMIGPPSLARQYAVTEVARFAGGRAHGVGQLLGEAALLAFLAFAGRRWLRVRL